MFSRNHIWTFAADGDSCIQTRAQSLKIDRILTCDDGQGGTERVRQDEVAAIRQPLVILGDPGLGKTVLAEALGSQPGLAWVRAGSFTRTADPASLIAKGERIVIDGLDEIASAEPGSAVVSVLAQLSAMGKPPFILTCREADWLGASDRIRIEDDYGAAPMVLRLQPFTRDDARRFLLDIIPNVDVDALLAHLEDRGLDALIGNPLTLRMLGEVAVKDSTLPETRSGLFGRACRVMLEERNPRHDAASHAQKTEEELLLAAGAICAALLLCDRVGVYAGPPPKTPEGFLNLADLRKLPHGDAAGDARRTRLFIAEGEYRFAPIHRVIAEHLGARWLARCFEEGMSERRLFSLLQSGAGVPTSLRGLHAWIAHFNETLARRCIEADPYAVLRYGDAETLNLDLARSLLSALKKLSEVDPYFRAEDWGRHPVSGLLRAELKDEICDIIEPPRRHVQLASLLLEAIAGTALAAALGDTLIAIMFDRQRYVGERSAAAKALFAAGIRNDWEAVIRRLLDMKDPDSARLAFETLRRLGLFGVPECTAVEIVLAYFGLPSDLKPREHRPLPDDLFEDIDAERLASWLDRFVEAARPLMQEADSEAEWYVTRLVRRIAAAVLEADPAVRPERIWNWIEWLDKSRAYDKDVNKRLVAVFRENRELRTALLEYVLLTPCAESTWMAGHRLFDTGLELQPTPEDIACILRSLGTQTGDGRIDRQTWQGLLMHGRTADGLLATVRNVAVKVADGDAELLSILEEVAKNPFAEREARQAERDAKEKAQREAVRRFHRDTLAERADDVAAGDVHLLELPACIYLHRSVALDAQFHFEADAAPEERLRAFLGDELADRVTSGFVAVLARDDLPSASGIVEVHCRNERYVAEAPMICGVMEVFRRGIGLDGIERDTLAAAYMAWQRGPESESSEPNALASEMEAVLFRSDTDWEDFFRTSIEPQLDRDRSHPNDLSRLACEPCLSGLAGRLSMEWLRRHHALNVHVQTELLACALRNAPREELRELVLELGERAHPNLAIRLLWLSAGYVVDLENRRPELASAAAEHPELIWVHRDRILSGNGQRFDRFSVDHLEFIVESFGEQWPNVPRPTGAMSGDCNPSDASDFIRETIYAISSRPDARATVALQRLIADCAQTYADTLKHALALQMQGRRDFDYAAPTIAEIQAVMNKALPESVDDMRVWFADRLDDFRDRIRGSDTNMREAYWSGADEPRNEEFCRDRMIEHVSRLLPESIRFGPEQRMPDRKRVDIAILRNAVKLPVEIKGQWNKSVWNAASDQLGDGYAIDWQAKGRGIYIVLWFGEIPGKNLPRHPDGLPRPTTPDELERMLHDRLPEVRRPLTDIFVIDLSRPAGAA